MEGDINTREENVKKKRSAEEVMKEFFIPRNFFDVIFIVICFYLAWYALTYDIAAAKVPVICANYWNKWALEKGIHVTPAGSINNTIIEGIVNITNP
jgi:hypothetical protein